jgi:regulator of cell morphogenesis and NO signaling
MKSEQIEMEIQEKTIGQVVAEDYRTATVFKSYGIDFCCQGGRSIQVACEEKGIAPETVFKSLEAVITESSGRGAEDVNSWPLDLLVDLIEKRHHTYVEKAITDLKPFLSKLVQVHGPQHSELIEIEKLFLESAGDLTQHMKKEELILFPFVRKMVAAKKEDRSVPAPHFGTVQSPVSMMMEEHENEGVRFRKISELSNEFTPPADGCNTYKTTYALLKEFEEDLHRHIHLENNILFPRAVELEKKLRN